MLIVNNSLPKCGGVWLHSILCRMVVYEAPGDRWRQQGWTSSSPSPADLPAFLEEEDWLSRNLLFKCHYGPRLVRQLNRPGIKVVCAVRHGADAALSLYHHLQRQGLNTPRDEWMATEGVQFASTLQPLRAAWSRIAHMVEYENLLANPEVEILRLSTFLGIRPYDAVARSIAAETQADKMRVRAGAHVRAAKAGAAAEDLPAELLALFAPQHPVAELPAPLEADVSDVSEAKEHA